MVVGNKCDLNDERKISLEQGLEISQELGGGFYEISAKTGLNVEKMMEELVKDIFKNYDEEEDKGQNV